MKLTKTQLLFLVIFIEGYVVLAAELIAMRQLIPFVGSGTEIVAIVISAVLLPLAVGYHVGGRAYARARKRNSKAFSVRKILLKNIISALVIFTLGLSYLFMEIFFGALRGSGITNRLLQTAIYAGMFIVTPVFLLGQTVPLVSNYFSRSHLSEITGKMLFFSTCGSFFGSVFSTIVLMSYLGVHVTVTVTCAMLFALIPLLSRRLFSYELVLGGVFLLIALSLNSGDLMRTLTIVSNNNYNTVAIYEEPKGEYRELHINRSASSRIAKDPANNFDYYQYIDNLFIKPILEDKTPRDILILGAGGFTLGIEDKTNRYTYVDIDPALKDVSEKHYLNGKLTPNKEFIPASARAFVAADKKQYDFIVLDVFTNMHALPMECTTREFLQDVKNRLKPGGIVLGNVIGSADFRDRFTIRYDNTFRSVFPHYQRQVISTFSPWKSKKDDINNLLYIYYDRSSIDDDAVYSDNKNTYSLDR